MKDEDKEIYPDRPEEKSEIAEALKEITAEGRKRWEKSDLRRVILKFIAVIILTLAVTLLIIPTLNYKKTAEEKGTKLGGSVGSFVGRAMGSYDGVTKGIPAGEEAGKAQGLSAEDTEAEIKGAIERVGRLQVLTAGVKMQNITTMGGDNDDYAALSLVKGNAVFTVDLKKCRIVYDRNNNGIIIFVPAPEADVYIDDNQTEKLAEYQKHPYSGSTVDGFKMAINSMNRTDEEMKKQISGYELLEEQARESAEQMIKKLAGEVSRGKTITVNFEEGDDNG